MNLARWVIEQPCMRLAPCFSFAQASALRHPQQVGISQRDHSFGRFDRIGSRHWLARERLCRHGRSSGCYLATLGIRDHLRHCDRHLHHRKSYVLVKDTGRAAREGNLWSRAQEGSLPFDPRPPLCTHAGTEEQAPQRGRRPYRPAGRIRNFQGLPECSQGRGISRSSSATMRG